MIKSDKVSFRTGKIAREKDRPVIMLRGQLIKRTQPSYMITPNRASKSMKPNLTELNGETDKVVEVETPTLLSSVIVRTREGKSGRRRKT